MQVIYAIGIWRRHDHLRETLIIVLSYRIDRECIITVCAKIWCDMIICFSTCTAPYVTVNKANEVKATRLGLFFSEFYSNHTNYIYDWFLRLPYTYYFMVTCNIYSALITFYSFFPVFFWGTDFPPLLLPWINEQKKKKKYK